HLRLGEAAGIQRDRRSGRRIAMLLVDDGHVQFLIIAEHGIGPQVQVILRLDLHWRDLSMRYELKRLERISQRMHVIAVWRGPIQRVPAWGGIVAGRYLVAGVEVNP